MELTEGGPMYALSEPLRPLVVLDRPAVGSAVHEGFGVEFDACGEQYGLTGFGLRGPELYALAESLHFAKQPGSAQGPFDPQCTDRPVRPHYVVLTCADAGSTADKLSWSSWGGEEATASGLLIENDCDPTCVGGTKRDYKATFRFYGRRAGRFTTVDITFTTSGPGGQRRRTSYL
ncbi:MAG: hypothetical protein JJD92_14800 [Frankiaceae bacterium]|nr:hypothetical protein [Frankiaceae bacterium]